MHDIIRRLLEVRAPGTPVLSVYLDTRPVTTSPGVRPYQTFLKRRFNELSGQADPRDIEAAWKYLEKVEPASRGLALFSCQAEGLFEAFQVEEPFQNHAGLGPVTHLYPLARYLERHAAYAVVAADSERARIYTVKVGHIREEARVTHPPDHPELPGRARPGIGASQLKYQRYLRHQLQTYLTEVVEALRELVSREEIPHLVLWGPERTVAELRAALPAELQSRIIDTVRQTPETGEGEILATTLAHLRERLDQASRGKVEDLLSEGRSGGLAALGLEATLEALYRGQVEELLLCADTSPCGRVCSSCQRPWVEGKACPDCATPLGPVQDLREELVRQAGLTGAHLEIVEDCPALRDRGGIGAALRYALT